MFKLSQSLGQFIKQVGIARRFTSSPNLLSSSLNPDANLHKVNNLEKKFLVWTGKYKVVGDVPNMVAGEVVEKARNKMRIRVANGMMILTLIACLVMSISGKHAHEKGESVQKENLAWHKAHQESAK